MRTIKHTNNCGVINQINEASPQRLTASSLELWLGGGEHGNHQKNHQANDQGDRDLEQHLTAMRSMGDRITLWQRRWWIVAHRLIF